MFTLVGIDEAAVELQPRAVGARAIDLRFTGALDLYHQFSGGGPVTQQAWVRIDQQASTRTQGEPFLVSPCAACT